MYRSILPLIDDFSSQIPGAAASILVTPTHVIPCTGFDKAQYPSSLIRHLLFSMPRPPPPPKQTSDTSSPTDGTLRPKRPPDPESPKKEDHGASTFLGMPTGNMSVNMDIRKWSLPGYLTFGKSPNKKSSKLNFDERPPAVKSESEPEPIQVEDAQVDRSALEDAMSSDNGTTSSSNSSIDGVAAGTLPVSGIDIDAAPPSPAPSQPGSEMEFAAQETLSPLEEQKDAPAHIPPPEFSSFFVHLASPEDPLKTRKQKVYYLTVFRLSDSSISGIKTVPIRVTRLCLRLWA